MKKWIARLFLKITGWQGVGGRPPHDQYVLISAPHTSNWDLAYMLAICTLYDIKVNWVGKSQLFRFGMGWLMRKLGGIPVNRSGRHNTVNQIVELFNQSDKLILSVPAEGTRSYTKYWKSGFYHIARLAKVPVVLGFLDYKNKQGGYGLSFHVTGDIPQDMTRIRNFYQTKTGKYPHQFGPIRLKEEDQKQALSG